MTSAIPTHTIPPAMPADGPGTSAKPHAARRWTRWSLLAILAAIIFVAQYGCVESYVFYVPTRNQIAVPTNVRELTIPTSDGLQLNAWFLPAKHATSDDGATPQPGPAVLFCHGNGGQLAYHMQFCEFLAARGINVLIYDYRGYGKSDLARRERHALMLDTRAALDALRKQPEVDHDRIGAFGMSLGGQFAAAITAEDPGVRALCTLSTFSSWRGVASDHVPLLGSILIPSGLDAVDSVAHLGDRPYLLIHGTSDNVIPVRHAYLLRDAAEKAGTPVELRIAQGGDHAMVLFNFPEERRAIEEFFTRSLAHRAASTAASTTAATAAQETPAVR